MMPDSTNVFMLDTNVFNRVFDRKTLLSFGKCRFLATGIQRDELNRTRDIVRRTALLSTFEVINPEVQLASSFAFDVEGAGFDQAYWNDGCGNFEKMRRRLQELDRASKDRENQERDILIAETAIKNGATLVSDDENLRLVVSEFGGCAIATSVPLP